MKLFVTVATVPCIWLLAFIQAAQPSAPRLASPVEPVAAILDAFRSNNIVALSEPHGNEQAHALRLALIRDPRFPTVANDIVWECGNARYQDVMDRFVRGEDVPDTALRQAWRNTGWPIGVLCNRTI